MRNVLRVFWRDVKRVAKQPFAWLVALFLIVLPSLYAWFNVAGFWNPYDNTSNLRICVVNEDAGAHDDALGDIDLGAQIIDELHGNDQLGWDFTDRDTAMDAVESGEAYAALIVPEDFSADMITLLTGDFQSPELEYYVNEKTGPVSPKITDTGATALDTMVNDTFVSTVSSAIATAIDAQIDTADARMQSAEESAVARIKEAADGVAGARAALGDLEGAASSAIEKADAAAQSLDEAKGLAALLSSALGDVSSLAADANTGIVGFSSSMGGVLDEGSMLISGTSAQTDAAIGQVAGAISAAQGDVDAALERAQAVVDENAQVVSALAQLAESLPEGAAKDAATSLAASLARDNADAQATIDGLGALSSDIADAASSAGAASGAVDDAVQGTLSSLGEYRSSLASTTVPELSDALSRIVGVTGGLSSASGAQTALIDQASSVLGQLRATLSSASDAFGQTEGVLADLEADFDTAKTDIEALGASDSLAQLFGGKLDSAEIADFMMSPTQVQTEKLYPLNAYGSAMAPLFINLALWIGVFMLMVIMRIEVDDEGIDNLTVTQGHLGRWLLLAVMASLQAVVCCAGCLIIGVQTASVPAFFLTAVAASLSYLAVQYALSTALQHVGKAICVILVFVQIPGATGLYPVEMTTSFFQAVYPAFPFTCGINAMREAIAGFYDGAWLADMGVLAAFFAVFMAAGILARPHMANLNRLFARQIEEGDIINGEAVQTPARRYSLTQLIRALSDRDEYRTAVISRASRFMRVYPKAKIAAAVCGIAVPAVVTVALSAVGAAREVVLTAWLVWLAAVVAFLIAMEYVRDSLNRQAALDSLSDAEVRTLYAERKGAPCVWAGAAGGEARDEAGGRRERASACADDGDKQDARYAPGGLRASSTSASGADATLSQREGAPCPPCESAQAHPEQSEQSSQEGGAR